MDNKKEILKDFLKDDKEYGGKYDVEVNK